MAGNRPYTDGLYELYLFHHAFAAFIYVYILHTKLLGGMGAVGLVFEFPIIGSYAHDRMYGAVRTKHDLTPLFHYRSGELERAGC